MKLGELSLLKINRGPPEWEQLVYLLYYEEESYNTANFAPLERYYPQ